MTNPDDDDEAIFLEKLGTLRHQATAYLDILNDIRKKTSKLPPESATAAHYKYSHISCCTQNKSNFCLYLLTDLCART